MIQILGRIYPRPMLRSLRLLNEGLLNQDPKKYEIKWVYLKISWNHNTNFTFEEVRLGTSGGTSSSCSTSRSRCGLRCCCCFFQTSEVVEVIIVVVVIVAADGSADAQAGFFCHWNFRKKIRENNIHFIWQFCLFDWTSLPDVKVVLLGTKCRLRQDDQLLQNRPCHLRGLRHQDQEVGGLHFRLENKIRKIYVGEKFRETDLYKL